jgi:hypothetical protein
MMATKTQTSQVLRSWARRKRDFWATLDLSFDHFCKLAARDQNFTLAGQAYDTDIGA